MCETRGFLAWRGRACVLAALVSLAACGPAVWQYIQFGNVHSAEPTATASFLSAFAGADEVAAERAASPLYAAEWARRGVSARDRSALEPHPSRANGTGAPWIAFTDFSMATQRRPISAAALECASYSLAPSPSARAAEKFARWVICPPQTGMFSLPNSSRASVTAGDSASCRFGGAALSTTA